MRGYYLRGSSRRSSRQFIKLLQLNRWQSRWSYELQLHLHRRWPVWGNEPTCQQNDTLLTRSSGCFCTHIVIHRSHETGLYLEKRLRTKFQEVTRWPSLPPQKLPTSSSSSFERRKIHQNYVVGCCRRSSGVGVLPFSKSYWERGVCCTLQWRCFWGSRNSNPVLLASCLL